MFVIKLILFVTATTGIIWVSWPSLRNVKNHGFYRFFAWEMILILFVRNVNYWIIDPLSIRQIISWVLLIISLVLIIQGVQSFRRKGKLDRDRDNSALVGIEKTTELVTTGVYHFIRHPFYSSLLFLAWGIFFKRISWISILLAVMVTVFLGMTAKVEEVENIQFFGEKYREYIENTKMFIPFIL